MTSDWPHTPDDPAACENCGYNPNSEEEREQEIRAEGRAEALREAAQDVRSIEWICTDTRPVTIRLRGEQDYITLDALAARLERRAASAPHPPAQADAGAVEPGPAEDEGTGGVHE